MSLSTLPTEVMLNIAEHLDRAADINALARANWRFYSILDEFLYWSDENTDGSKYALNWAAVNNRIATAIKAVVHGVGPRKRDGNSLDVAVAAALSFAIRCGNPDMIDFLLQNGAVASREMLWLAITQRPELTYRASPVHGAGMGPGGLHEMSSRYGMEMGEVTVLTTPKMAYLTAISTLLHRGAPPDERCLSHAIGQEHYFLTRLLLRHGARADQAALHKAIGQRNIAFVKLLLENGAVGDDTALAEAATHGPLAMVRLLVTKGVAPNPTALQNAVKANSNGVVRFLLRAGVNPDVPDDLGLVPLVYAVARGFLPVLQLLADYGADLNVRQRDGQNLVSSAVSSFSPNRRKIVQFLLQNNADVEVEDSYGMTALCWGVNYGRWDLLNMMLAQRPNARLRNIEGKRLLLHEAAEYGADKAAAKLIDAGVDVDEVDAWGETALSVAARSGQIYVFKMLLSMGANPNHVDNYGRTAFMWAYTGYPRAEFKSRSSYGRYVKSIEGILRDYQKRTGIAVNLELPWDLQQRWMDDICPCEWCTS